MVRFTQCSGQIIPDENTQAGQKFGFCDGAPLSVVASLPPKLACKPPIK
jgi:hypothetical protein